MDTADLVVRRRTEWILLISALVVLGVSGVPVQHGRVPGAERAVFHWVNDLPGILYGPLATIMQLGNAVAVFIGAAVAVTLRRFRLAFGLVLAGGGAYLASKTVKQLVARGRPASVLAGVHERGAHAGGMGYVSGHAAVAFALATVATMWFGPKGRAVLWILAGLVAFARVYVGAHLPLDVVGGAALGCVCGALVRLLIGARRHGRQARVQARSPR